MRDIDPPWQILLKRLRQSRVANAVWRITGDARFRHIAEEAMRYIVTPQIARANTAAPTLLADAELTATP